MHSLQTVRYSTRVRTGRKPAHGMSQVSTRERVTASMSLRPRNTSIALDISLLAPPVAPLLPLETEVAPQPTPKTTHGTSLKNTPVRHVHVVRSDIGRIPEAGGAEVAPPAAGLCVPGHGVHPLRVVWYCPLNAAALSCGKSSGAVAASPAPHPELVWLD